MKGYVWINLRITYIKSSAETELKNLTAKQLAEQLHFAAKTKMHR
jgi:hypothetical protein